MDFEKMSSDALELAKKLHAESPEVPKLECGKVAKKAVMFAEACKHAEAKLNKKGKTLSEKGLEFIASEVAKHFAEGAV